jgi:hypothetical protein
MSAEGLSKKTDASCREDDDKILSNIRVLGAEVLWCGAPARMKTRFEDVVPPILPLGHGSVPGTRGKTTIETALKIHKLT